MAVNQQRYDSKQIRSIRELFKGRFTENDIRVVFEDNGRNPHNTVTYLLETPPEQVRADIRERLNQLPEHVRTNAQTRQHATEGDLYACHACDKFWWRLSPMRKQVSRCNLCGRRYDMVDPQKWWGWAEFNCEHCGRTFGGWCHMEVASPCHNCQHWILPTRIVPPRRTRERRPRRNVHTCAHCIQGQMHVRPPHGQNKCAYMPFRRAHNLAQVIDPSGVHDSSGSTVDTFLPQGDLLARYKDFDDLETVAEGRSDSD